MTALIQTVQTSPEYVLANENRNIPHTSFRELIFAEDTRLLSSNPQTMEFIPNTTEHTAALSALTLYKGECPLHAIKDDNPVAQFTDGTLLQAKREITYTGALLTDTLDTSEEIAKRIKACMASWRK